MLRSKSTTRAYGLLFHSEYLLVRLIETWSKDDSCQGPGGEELGSCCVMGTRVPLAETDSEDGCTAVQMYTAPGNNVHRKVKL